MLASLGHHDESSLFPWWLSRRGTHPQGPQSSSREDFSLQDGFSSLKLVKLNTSPRCPVGIVQWAVEPLHRILGQCNQYSSFDEGLNKVGRCSIRILSVLTEKRKKGVEWHGYVSIWYSIRHDCCRDSECATMAWGFFWDENHKGPKDSLRNFDILPICLEELDEYLFQEGSYPHR